MSEQATKTAPPPTGTGHGAMCLPTVEVDSYNLELRDDEGFLGDRASKGAFRKILENWRKGMRKAGEDPFGDLDRDPALLDLEELPGARRVGLADMAV